MRDKLKFKIMIFVTLAFSMCTLVCFLYIVPSKPSTKAFDIGQKIYRGQYYSAYNFAPISQAEMNNKYEAMSEITENGKTITIISERYLDEYWRNINQNGSVVSLSTDEVYYIVRDSIEKYLSYDFINLAGNGTIINAAQLRAKGDYETDIDSVYQIIIYRLSALSSSETFISAFDAMNIIGKHPELDSSFYTFSNFYVSGYNEKTDRDTVIKIIGKKDVYNTWDEPVCFWDLTYRNQKAICLYSKGYNSQIFPTKQMEEKQSIIF